MKTARSQKGPQRVRHGSEDRRRALTQPVLKSVIDKKVEILRQVLGQDVVIARLLGVSPAQLSRWKKGQMPEETNRARIRVLTETVAVLLERYQPSVIVGWFESPGIGGGRRPVDLLHSGEWGDLRAYAEEAAAGAFS
jgi:hypothetical protein